MNELKYMYHGEYYHWDCLNDNQRDHSTPTDSSDKDVCNKCNERFCKPPKLLTKNKS